MRIKGFFVISGSLLSLASGYSAEANTYIVKKGDTLSQIALSHLPGRVWGKKGSLEKIMSMNPHIHNQDLIYPKEIVELGGDPPTPIKKTKISTPTKIESSPTRVGAPHTQVEQPVSRKPATKPFAIDQWEQRERREQRQKSQQDQRPASNEQDTDPDEITATVGYGFTSFQAQDPSNSTQGNLVTSYSVNVKGAWVQNWSPKFATFLVFSVNPLDFQPSTNPQKTLTTTNKVLAHGSLGASQAFGEKFKLKYYVSYGHELFLHGLTSTSVAIDAVAVPALSAEGSYRLFKHGVNTFGARVTASTTHPRLQAGLALAQDLVLKEMCS